MCVMLQLSEERWSPDHLLLPPEKISGAAGESKLAARIRSRNAGERRAQHASSQFAFGVFKRRRHCDRCSLQSDAGLANDRDLLKTQRASSRPPHRTGTTEKHTGDRV